LQPSLAWGPDPIPMGPSHQSRIRVLAILSHSHRNGRKKNNQLKELLMPELTVCPTETLMPCASRAKCYLAENVCVSAEEQVRIPSFALRTKEAGKHRSPLDSVATSRHLSTLICDTHFFVTDVRWYHWCALMRAKICGSKVSQGYK
jgi:hypothetical protein